MERRQAARSPLMSVVAERRKSKERLPALRLPHFGEGGKVKEGTRRRKSATDDARPQWKATHDHRRFRPGPLPLSAVRVPIFQRRRGAAGLRDRARAVPPAGAAHAGLRARRGVHQASVAGRSTSFCACELRSPGQFTDRVSSTSTSATSSRWRSGACSTARPIRWRAPTSARRSARRPSRRSTPSRSPCRPRRRRRAS